MHAGELHISDYTYALPEERIAKYPLAVRHESKLLVWKGNSIAQSSFLHLHDFVPNGSLMVFNNTRVIQARLLFTTCAGATVEVFCLEPETGSEPYSAMQQQGKVRWQCLVGRVAKWKEKMLTLKHDVFLLNAEIICRNADVFVVEFTWLPEKLTFAELLSNLGNIPIPPYLKRKSDSTDTANYQTLYAKTDGSVAAPTAGLHFTPVVFSNLDKQNVSVAEVTLHVGAGTFKPVKTKTIGEHTMHAEWFETNLRFIEALLHGVETKQTIVAVGTTSLRTIETLYWMGVKAFKNHEASLNELEVRQWDIYEVGEEISVTDALAALIKWMQKNQLYKLIAQTQILIAPSYKLKLTRALVTNFHQPNSTLLLLVAAVVGEQWREIYRYALENEFRFLSYGDSSLLFAE